MPITRWYTEGKHFLDEGVLPIAMSAAIVEVGYKFDVVHRWGVFPAGILYYSLGNLVPIAEDGYVVTQEKIVAIPSPAKYSGIIYCSVNPHSALCYREWDAPFQDPTILLRTCFEWVNTNTPSGPKKCVCLMRNLMMRGCTCGGI